MRRRLIWGGADVQDDEPLPGHRGRTDAGVVIAGQPPVPPGPAPGRSSAPFVGAAGRYRYLDNLKVVLIASVIGLHGVLGYIGTLDAWSYTGVREVTLSPVVEAALIVVVAPFGFFMMTLLFLIAGLLTERSLQRKGTPTFVRDRLLRLGVPFVIFVLVVQPTLIYALEHPLGTAPGSYWEEYLGEERSLDTGPLWFVGVLLILSLAYAGTTAHRRHRASASLRGPVTVRDLVVLAAFVAPASFLVRLVYPYGSEAGFSDLNFWQWPACIAAFAVGIRGFRRGWLDGIPDDLSRRCRVLTWVGLIAMAALLGVAGLHDVIGEMLGGWHWAALLFALVESPLTIFGSVWLLAVAKRRLDRSLPWGAALARSAYAAFLVQGLVLLGTAVVLRPVQLPAEAKAVVVAVCGVVGSFALGWVLVTRVRGLTRVL